LPTSRPGDGSTAPLACARAPTIRSRHSRTSGLFETVDARPAVSGARAVGKDHAFKKVNDEETKRALFPSNYPPAD